MKKTGLLVLGAIVLLPLASWALPPVTLANDCTAVFDPATGFNGQAASLMGILGGLGVAGLPSDYTLADLENGFVGDGVPDYLQMGILGALLCSGNAEVTAQFDANRAQYLGLLSTVQAVFADITTLAANMVTGGNDINAWLATEVSPGVTLEQYLQANDPTNLALIQAVAAGLIDGGTSTQTFITTYGTYVPVLGTFQYIFAGLAGLNSEMKATIDDLLGNQLLGELAGFSGDLVTAAGGCAALAALSQPPMTPALASELGTLAASLNAMATTLTTIPLPTFVIYGVAKTASEPLSGAADYNGNGDTNSEVFQNVVVSHGGTEAEYVAAATGANPFYSGAPGLPVAGLLGLSLLAGAFGVAGAFSIRKK